MRDLAAYEARRDFKTTPEPRPGAGTSGPAPRFSIQRHGATRLHWDLRLEHDGVLLSWAITRGPSLDPKDKRLAVRTEDHPLDYLTFEGVIAPGNYGAGTVMLWDLGWWQPFHDVDDGLAQGHLHFAFLGDRVTGKFSLVRIKGDKAGDAGRENWLLVKEADEAAGGDIALTHDTSVATGRTAKEITQGKPPRPLAPARRSPPPMFRPPQLAELQKTPPDGPDWLHEVKLDGYRAQISIGKGGARIFTRSGLDWTDRFPSLLPALARLPARTALIDGEITAGAGLDRFGDIARVMDHGGPFLLYAFDLLVLDGHDMTARPLHRRRIALETLFAQVTPRGVLRLSPLLQGDPQDLFDRVSEAGGEGLVSKLRDAPYRGGRSSAWVKVKAERRGAFVIVGYQHSPSRGRAFASLLLASHEGGRLVYRGKVGTGFDSTNEAALRKDLEALVRPDPVIDPPHGLNGKVTWVAPRLIAEIRYAEITRDGHLRQASFIALREDKALAEVVTDDPAIRPKVAGIGISHPDRVIWPGTRITKAGVAENYAAVADRLLAQARDRPLSLLRLPDGLGGQVFFQKHLGKGFPSALREVQVPDTKGKVQAKMVLTNPASLIAAVQMGAVEFHTGGIRTDRPDQPDRMILDLDPDEGLAFARVRDAAFLIRDLLDQADLPSWCLLTGGKGIHVTVPLRRRATVETVTLFSRLLATMLAERRPRDFTARLSKAERKGRIFIDWMRNEPGATAITPWSLRARPGAPVAVPVTWDELRQVKRADGFGIENVIVRDAVVFDGKSGMISEGTIDKASEALTTL